MATGAAEQVNTVTCLPARVRAKEAFHCGTFNAPITRKGVTATIRQSDPRAYTFQQW
jgi:hypothetical protein